MALNAVDLSRNTHTHTRTHACTHARTHAHSHIHTHTHARTHACTHTHTHTHTHAHRHTHTQSLSHLILTIVLELSSGTTEAMHTFVQLSAMSRQFSPHTIVVCSLCIQWFSYPVQISWQGYCNQLYLCAS